MKIIVPITFFATLGFVVANAAANTSSDEISFLRRGRHLTVSCGGHFANKCSECPQGNGSAWCNGDCVWENNKCTSKPKKSCGNGKFVNKCSECPSNPGSCSSDDCAWHPHTSLCRDAFSNNVRTASVHLNYSPPINNAAWWFQRVIPTGLSEATYLSSNGHSFGYGGIQQVDKKTGKVIFSLWDQGGCDQDVNPNCNKDDVAKTVACGDGVTCSDFGGEGTGRKSYLTIENKFPEIGQEYYFVTQAAYVGDRKMQYTGYFYMDGEWKLLSRIEVSTNANKDWSLDGLYSFVEQWTEVDTLSERSALYGPSFMAGTDGKDFVQIDSAWFSHGTLENHEHVNAWQAGADEDFAIGIATGGDVKRDAVRGESFQYKKTDPYPLLEEFSGIIPCLNKASKTGEIEKCLAVSPPPPPTDSPTTETKKCKDDANFKLGKKRTCSNWVAMKKTGKRCGKKADDDGKKIWDYCHYTCGLEGKGPCKHLKNNNK